MTLKTIQRGNTLGQMVAAYNREFNAKLSVAEVAKANGLKDANKIQAGGTLIFPDKFETNAPTKVIRNAEGGKTLRSGQSEKVDVTSSSSSVTTEPGKVSTVVQNRPMEKLPEAPKTVATKTEQPITMEPGKVSTTVQNRPLEKLPEAPKVVKTEQPITTEPGKVSTTVQSRPLEKLPEPPVKTTLSLTEFLAANKDQKLSVDSLRGKGVKAASSDLNGDGVIAGKNELTSLFTSAGAKNKTVADLTKGAVAKNFEGIGAAQRLDVAPYSSVDLARVKATLQKGTAERMMTVNPENARALGLSPGSTQFTVSTPVDETRGMGNRINSVAIYRDARSGQYFKEYNNDADGKNTPMVPLTSAEKELVRGLSSTELNASGPNQQAMMNELFSFDGDS
jgi:hypothetical protein